MTVYFELNNARAAARDLSQGLRLGATAQIPKVSVMSLLPWRQQDIETGRIQHANPQGRMLVASRVIECSRPDTDDLTARQCGACPS